MRKPMQKVSSIRLRRLARHATLAHMSTHQAPAEVTVPRFHAGDRLWKARERTGLDQSAFAQLLGISRGSVSNYERSTTPPKPIVLKAWAEATGVPLEWLAFGEEPVDSTPPPPGPGARADAVARLAARKAGHAVSGDKHGYAA